MRGGGKVVTEVVVEDPFANVNMAILPQHLPRQSPRWCQLTTTLLSLVVHDSQRTVEPNGLIQFFEVLQWRAHGKISGEEFSILYNEWMSENKAAKKKTSISTAPLRAILLEKKYQESDLDLFIGILVNELNMRLLNSTINFSSKKMLKQGHVHGLEVVTDKWLALSEELFFCLDTPGYGIWKFDDCLFFVSCLLVGGHTWSNEAELEGALSLSSLTSLTAQFLRDCGAQPQLVSARQGSFTAESMRNGRPVSQYGSTTVSSSRVVATGKQEVTLSMFKRHLLRKAISEMDLNHLISHVRHCIDHLWNLANQSNAQDLALSCQPYELRGVVLGGPRLWQESVLIASGFLPPQATSSSSTAPHLLPAIPPILLFLLVDAEKQLSLAFRALDYFPEEEFAEEMSLSHLQEGPSSYSAIEEIDEMSRRLYHQYRKWLDASAAGGAINSRPTVSAASALLASEMQRDPVFRLIRSALLHYKRLQHLLNAALYDLSISRAGSHPDGLQDALQVLCTALLPDNRAILSSLGLADPNVAGSVVDDMGAEMDAEEIASTVDTSPSQRRSSFMRRGSMLTASTERPGDGGLLDTQSLASVMGGNGRISNLPAAARRRTSLAATNEPPPPPPPPTPAQEFVEVATPMVASTKVGTVTAAPGSAASSIASSSKPKRPSSTSSNGIPNYRKPTSNFAQRVSRSSGDGPSTDDETPITKTPSRGGVDKEASTAQWKSMLDQRLRTSQPTKPETTISEPARSGSDSNTGQRVISDQEAQLINALVQTTDPMEQMRLVEQLRHLQASSSSQKSSPVPQSSGLSTGSRAVDEVSLSSSQRIAPLTPPMVTAANSSRRGAPAAGNNPNSSTYDGYMPAPPYTLAATRAEVSSAHSDAASSSIPSSIAEMLQQGQSPGRYAAMLRDILRKMSRDDSNVRIKSLEQVLKLGQELVQKEAGGSPSSMAAHPQQQMSSSSPPSRRMPPTNLNSAFSSEGPSRLQAQQHVARSYAMQSQSQSRSMMGAGEGGQQPPKVIGRASRAPGILPDRTEKKSGRAFGHPING